MTYYNISLFISKIMIGARVPSKKGYRCEYRCMMDATDFEKLVSGKVVCCDFEVGGKMEKIKVALKDIGYDVMREIIANAREHNFVTEPFNDK